MFPGVLEKEYFDRSRREEARVAARLNNPCEGNSEELQRIATQGARQCRTARVKRMAISGPVFSGMNRSGEEPAHSLSIGNEALRYCSAGMGCVPDSGAASRFRAFLSERSSTSV